MLYIMDKRSVFQDQRIWVRERESFIHRKSGLPSPNASMAVPVIPEGFWEATKNALPPDQRYVNRKPCRNVIRPDVYLLIACQNLSGYRVEKAEGMIFK